MCLNVTDKKYRVKNCKGLFSAPTITHKPISEAWRPLIMVETYSGRRRRNSGQPARWTSSTSPSTIKPVISS